MEIKINRTPSEPPTRDYSQRDTQEAADERLRVFNALASLQIGQSIEFTGEGATRDRINGFLTLQRQINKTAFTTAKIPGGIGVWRVA